MQTDDLTDVRNEVDDGLAWIAINRPGSHNSFPAHTVDRLIWALEVQANAGTGAVAIDAVNPFLTTPEAREGVDAFVEERSPDFGSYR